MKNLPYPSFVLLHFFSPIYPFEKEAIIAKNFELRNKQAYLIIIIIIIIFFTI